MTNEQILKKAIAKAVDNGLDEEWLDKIDSGLAWDMTVLAYHYIIFSHDFAKAFWKGGIYEWQYYLQEMVLEEEPLKYIKTFL